jgi:hypothetical protein
MPMSQVGWSGKVVIGCSKPSKHAASLAFAVILAEKALIMPKNYKHPKI